MSAGENNKGRNVLEAFPKPKQLKEHHPIADTVAGSPRDRKRGPDGIKDAIGSGGMELNFNILLAKANGGPKGQYQRRLCCGAASSLVPCCSTCCASPNHLMISQTGPLLPDSFPPTDKQKNPKPSRMPSDGRGSMMDAAGFPLKEGAEPMLVLFEGEDSTPENQ